MKKVFLPLLALSLLLVPAAGNAAYLLLLKNGGRLTTPLYWVEGGQLYFFYAGGVVGIARGEIDRVEKRTPAQNQALNNTMADMEKKETPPPVAGKEKMPLATKGPAEKLDIAAQKRKKDQLTVELNDLLEKRRQANARKDTDAKARITEEIHNTSTEIYRMTDAVKEQNKGQLPAGWWDQ